MLCHLSVAPLMRGALSHLGPMQAALAGLRAIGRQARKGWRRVLHPPDTAHLAFDCFDRSPLCPFLTYLPIRRASLPNPSFLLRREAEERGGMLADTRRQCQSEFTRSLRNHEWAQVGGQPGLC